MNPLYPEMGQMPQGMGQMPQDMGMAQNQAAAPRSPQGGGGGMSQGDQARLTQWQSQFQNAQRMAQEPKRPTETPEQFQMRQRAAYEQLRQLQARKPTGYSPSQGRMQEGQPAQPKQNASGLYDYIAKMLGGGQ